MDDIENLPLDQLSQATEEWDSVAAAQLVKDRLADQIFRLPLEEFRALKYVPPPLPRDIPNIGIDITVSDVKTLVRDGSSVAMRVYKPIDPHADALLFFNAHGGGTATLPPSEQQKSTV
jgi:acetyl esterase/lipase